MSHNLTGLVGRLDTLARFAAMWPQVLPTPLSQGLVLIGLDEARLDSLAMSEAPSFAGFVYLHAELAQAIALFGSGSEPWLYFETEYSSGTGRQSAALFRDGAMQWQRTSGEVTVRNLARQGPISEGLAELGAKRALLNDEFESIGLCKCRRMDDLGF